MKELNERLTLAEFRMKALDMMNAPVDAEEQLKVAARYRLAREAWLRCKKDFDDAINALSTGELEALATGPDNGLTEREELERADRAVAECEARFTNLERLSDEAVRAAEVRARDLAAALVAALAMVSGRPPNGRRTSATDGRGVAQATESADG